MEPCGLRGARNRAPFGLCADVRPRPARQRTAGLEFQVAEATGRREVRLGHEPDPDEPDSDKMVACCGSLPTAGRTAGCRTPRAPASDTVTGTSPRFASLGGGRPPGARHRSPQ
jgi:hypothetical protein